MPAESFTRRPATPEEVKKETSIPFSLSDIERITEEYDTPFFIYDEAGIRQNARNFREAFSWSQNFTNFFAVKALPNPHILKILMEEGFGADCSSMAELEIAERVGLPGDKIMFTSNNTPWEQFKKAKELGAIINLDDITHLSYLEKHVGLPDTLCFRYNPGADREGNEIIGQPEEAKYGLTKDQLFKAYKIGEEKGVKNFGLHTMIISNELNGEYFEETARMLFRLVNELKDEGIDISFINLGGGVGIPYRPEQDAVNINEVSSKIRADYQDKIARKRLDPLQITMECGRYITGPHGFLVTKVRHIADKYRRFVGLDASTTSMPRVTIYQSAYHHDTVLGKEGSDRDQNVILTGSLCEGSDVWTRDQKYPEIEIGNTVVVHDAGAHAIAMANEYNGQLIPGELLLKPDGSVLQIRRPRTIDDYFSTITNFEGFGS